MTKLHVWRARHPADPYNRLARYIVAISGSQARQMAEVRQLEIVMPAHWVRAPGHYGPWNSEPVREICRWRARERRARQSSR